MRRILIVSLAAGLMAAACGSSDTLDSTTAAPATTAAQTTQATQAPETTVTTAAPATTATTAAPATTATTAAPAPSFPVVLDGAGHPELPPVLGNAGSDPNGSGCVPGSATILPDGIWFGYAQAVAGGVITFDMGCFFSEPAASAAAAADGYGEVEDGYYIRNQNPLTYAATIDPAADVYFVDGSPGGADFFPQPIPLGQWPSPNSYLPCPGGSCAVWLYVNGGVVTGIVEQYLP